MLVFPKVWRVREFVRSPLAFLPLAAAYGLLLARSWGSDTLALMMPGSLADALKGGSPQFFPKLEGIQARAAQPSGVCDPGGEEKGGGAL